MLGTPPWGAVGTVLSPVEKVANDVRVGLGPASISKIVRAAILRATRVLRIDVRSGLAGCDAVRTNAVRWPATAVRGRTRRAGAAGSG
jgi:hypothetical protein